jgi:hypothetical protein
MRQHPAVAAVVVALVAAELYSCMQGRFLTAGQYELMAGQQGEGVRPVGAILILLAVLAVLGQLRQHR